MGIRYGTGTVIDRMAHAHLGHGGLFEACPRCQSHRLIWTPSTDFGIVVHTASGRLVENSDLARRLLTP